MNDPCKNCSVRKEFINLASIMRDYFDVTLRLTWAEKNEYRQRIVKILERLNP